MTTPTLTREQALRLKWERGTLKFLLKPHQLPIYESIWACINDPDDEHTSHVINCSRQFGKSFTELLIATEFCIRVPASIVLFVAPMKSQALEVLTGKTYFTLFDTCPEDLKPKLDNSTVVFPNGSRLRLGGTDNRHYEHLRGGAAHLLILDEAGFMANLDDGVLPALQPMLTTTKGKTLFSSTPPPSLDHPYVDIYRTHAEEDRVSTFTIFENKSLTEGDLLKALKQTGSTLIKNADGTEEPLYSTRFRREYLAEFVMENTIRLANAWHDHFIRELAPNEYHQFHHRYVSMDPGTTDFNATLFGYYDHINRHLHLEAELVLNGNELDSRVLSESIKNIMKDRWGSIKPYRMVADNNNLHLIADLKRIYELPFFGTSKGRLETTKAKQDEGMVNKVNTWLREGRISVHPRCEQLIGCLRYGIWKEIGENKREFAHSKTYGHYDAFAALVYMVRNVDQTTNPVDPMYRHSTANEFIPQKMLTPGAQNKARYEGFARSLLGRK